MATKEAIEVLNRHLYFYKINDCTTDAEAITCAIKALEEKYKIDTEHSVLLC